jgi:hypothetical protein
MLMPIIVPQPATAPRTAPILVQKNESNNRGILGATMPSPSTSPSPKEHQDMFKKEPRRKGEILEIFVNSVNI